MSLRCVSADNHCTFPFGVGEYMKILLTIVLLTGVVSAQNFVAPSHSGTSSLPDAPSQHRFWNTETKVSTGLLAGLVAADAFTTQRGLNNGYREANPIMRPLVTQGTAGQAAGSHQAVEVQSRRRGRTRQVARVPTGLPGRDPSVLDARGTLVRRRCG